MYEIDNIKFGQFVAKMRKEKGFTQKELAERLFVSDKAVSKWERGLSMPDIALLRPLADLLGVSITALLSGHPILEPKDMDMQKAENLVSATIQLSQKEKTAYSKNHGRHIKTYTAGLLLVTLECLLLYAFGYSLEKMLEDIFTIEILNLIFGAWFFIFAKESLPPYYDAYKVHTYSDGIFRMSIAGVRFNNNNWPHILQAGRLWSLSAAIFFPLFYLVSNHFFIDFWVSARLFLTLFACLGIFIPMIVAGKRFA